MMPSSRVPLLIYALLKNPSVLATCAGSWLSLSLKNPAFDLCHGQFPLSAFGSCFPVAFVCFVTFFFLLGVIILGTRHFLQGLLYYFLVCLFSEWIICSSAGTTSGRPTVAQDKGDFGRVTPSLSLI